MNITVIGRGRVGGGLARLWARAGHEVRTLGRDGGDASDTVVVVVAVPDHLIGTALHGVTGLNGQVTIDVSNLHSERDTAFPSLAHQVKSVVGGPTAKAFNTVFASAYDQIGEQRVTPSNRYAAEPDAEDVTARQLRSYPRAGRPDRPVLLPLRAAR
ncbi:dinucleotide-binding protein [Streptomyces sp. NPDC047061]|uniref:dinucleotide-binding protein n=1 Tax=Streptomyces sp. NPDC047061 TaxID=3154605 RepID=UPI0033CC96C5